METNPNRSGFWSKWTFRPILCWLLLSVGLFAWRYHYTHAARASIQLSATTENPNYSNRIEVFVNDLPHTPGMPTGLGNRSVRVVAPEHDSFTTNVFVSYGGVNLGDIQLPRSRGSLELLISPTARRASITGSETQADLTNVAKETLTLPTGRYTVTVEFDRFQVDRSVEVRAAATERLSLTTNLVALHLTSEPNGAEFELVSKHRPSIRASNVTPITLTGLPTGDFELSIARSKYRQTIPVTLSATNATNELNVPFRYASLTVESDPAGAEIRDGAEIIGRTPAKLSLQPGILQLSISKAGFLTTNVNVALNADSPRALTVTLVNQAYAEAIREARQLASSSLASPESVLEQVAKVLEIRSDDPEALTIRRRAQVAMHERKAREYLRTGKTEWALNEIGEAVKLLPGDADVVALQREIQQVKEKEDEQKRLMARQQEEQRQKAEAAVSAKRAEDRKQRPWQRFNQILAQAPHANLFQSHQFRLTSTKDAVYRSVVEGLQRKPEWTIKSADVSDPDIAVIQAELSGFGRREKAIIVIGQTADQEVMLYAKLIVLVLGRNVELTLSGIPDSSYIPKHPRYVTDMSVSTINDGVNRSTQAFLQRLPR